MCKKKLLLAATILFLSYSCLHKKSHNFNISVKNIDSILKLEKRCIEKKERLIFYDDTINFSNEIDRIIFEKDTLIYKNDDKGFKEIMSLNSELMTKHTLQNQEFNIDDMDLVVDLNEIHICYLKNNGNIIIVETKPMNWVGIMTKFSLIHLINKKEKTVVEYIRED
jgi:hypothetical protein